MKKDNEWCTHPFSIENDPLYGTPLARGIPTNLWSHINWGVVYNTCPKCLPKYLDHVRMLKLKQDLLK